MSQKRCSKRLAANRVDYVEVSGSDSEGADQDSTRSYNPDKASDDESLDFSVLDLEPTTITITKTTGRKTTTTTTTTNRPYFTPAPPATAAPPATSNQPISKRNRYGKKNKIRHDDLNARWLAKTGKAIPDNCYVQLRKGKLISVIRPVRIKVTEEIPADVKELLKVLYRKRQAAVGVKARAEQIIAETNRSIMELTCTALEELDFESFDVDNVDINWDLLDRVLNL